MFKLYLDDVEQFFQNTDSRGLVRRIEGNTLHYKSIIESAILSSLPDPSLASAEHFEEDVIDVLLRHRAERDAATRNVPQNIDLEAALEEQNAVVDGIIGLTNENENDDEKEENPTYLEEFSKRL